MDPYELGGALWRQRLLVVLVFLATLAAVSIGVLAAPKSYTATAVLEVVDPTRTLDAADLDSLRSTLGESANSSAVAAATAARLRADDDLDESRTIEELRRSISGEWIEGSTLIEVAVTDRDRRVAAELANIVARDTLRDASTLPEPVELEMTERARVPTSYSNPDLPVVAGAGLLVAVVAAACGAVLRDRRRATVDDGRVAEAAAMAPLLAHVEAPADPTELPALHPGTMAADTFRSLRGAVVPEHESDASGVVVVAGIGAGEASVWVGANLAISLASDGRSVLMVDARMATQRGPAMAETPGDVGLAEVLRGAPLSAALSPGPVPGLTVLPAGEAGEASTGSLLRAGFATLVEQATASFDSVVVLAPPMDAGTDAQVMAADHALLLAISERAVSAATLHAYADLSRTAGSRVLGVVLVGHHGARVHARRGRIQPIG